jgi:hypothetical protein
MLSVSLVRPFLNYPSVFFNVYLRKVRCFFFGLRFPSSLCFWGQTMKINFKKWWLTISPIITKRAMAFVRNRQTVVALYIRLIRNGHNDHGYVPFDVITIMSFLRTWLITGIVTRVTRRVLHMEQVLFTFQKHLRHHYRFSYVTINTILLVYISILSAFWIKLWKLSLKSDG